MTEENRTTKQVIVMRKDLNMRKGKMVAQGAHASLGAILAWQRGAFSDACGVAVEHWLANSFTKICVSVSSERELIDIYSKAITAGIPYSLICDAGHTEFGGKPTHTCCAIGPAFIPIVDEITGGLPLL